MATDLASAIAARYAAKPPEQRRDNEGPDAPELSAADLTALVETLEQGLNTADFHRLTTALAAKAVDPENQPQSLSDALTQGYRRLPGGPR